MTHKVTAKESMKVYNKKTVSLEMNHVQIYQYSHTSDDINQLPLLILHADCQAGESVLEACQQLKTPPFHLAVINDTVWERDMTPWAAPPAFKKSSPFTGGADVYLQKLENELLISILTQLSEKPDYIALAGYSLAGLFAIYSAYKSSLFSRIVSASASLWYQDFITFTDQHKLSPEVQSIYLSLGDRESHTKNQQLQTVEDKTIHLYQQLKKQELATVFEYNKGGHFNNSAQRLAKGIKWMLSHPAD